MQLVICGGGVIGAATAYFLSLRGAKATVIERTLNFSEEIPDIERRSAWRSDLR